MYCLETKSSLGIAVKMSGVIPRQILKNQTKVGQLNLVNLSPQGEENVVGANGKTT
jgi:hypothetical protein